MLHYFESNAHIWNTAHASCLSKITGVCSSIVLDISLITMNWSDLRRSFVRHYRDTLLTEEAIMGLSFEDGEYPSCAVACPLLSNAMLRQASILYDALWTQLQVLMSGVASGSIIIEQTTPSTPNARLNRVDEFELHYCVRLLEAYLRSGRNQKSFEVAQHLHQSGGESTLLYDWSLLGYVVAMGKSSVSEGLGNDDYTSPSFQSPEVATLAQFRDALGSELNILSDVSARHLLAHLNAMGLIRRVDLQPQLIADGEDPASIVCAFPLPLLLDTSVDVETLVTTIEAGLEDIDVSVNESVLLLLTRRCWPTIWAADYGLERLAHAVFEWICSEVRE